MGESHNISAHMRQTGEPSSKHPPRASQNIYYLYTHIWEMHEISRAKLEAGTGKEASLSGNSYVS